MKKATFLQIIFILFIVSIWNVLHLGFNYQSERYEKELSSLPMILVCPEQTPLQNIKAYLDTMNIVLRTKLEADTLIKKNLIENYHLTNAESLLGSFDVPSVLKIYFNGSTFNLQKKRELEVFFNTSYPEVIISYDHDFWQIDSRKIELLKKGYFFANIFIAVFLFFSIIFLRIHFESKRHEYWRIFRSAGGKRIIRRRQFLFHSLFICCIPVGLNAAAYFVATHYNYLPVDMNIQIFAVEFILIVIAVIFSRLLMGKNF